MPRCDSILYECDFLANGDVRQETKTIKNIYRLKNWDEIRFVGSSDGRGKIETVKLFHRLLYGGNFLPLNS
jgi:hypothetical protein